jgi:thiamine biosynthesis lipoprotein
MNRRVWNGYTHILDPFTKRPAAGVIATWVIADKALVADGLATALFFVDDVGPLLKEFHFTFVRLFNDGTVDYSPAFDGELFI